MSERECEFSPDINSIGSQLFKGKKKAPLLGHIYPFKQRRPDLSSTRICADWSHWSHVMFRVAIIKWAPPPSDGAQKKTVRSHCHNQHDIVVQVDLVFLCLPSGSSQVVLSNWDLGSSVRNGDFRLSYPLLGGVSPPVSQPKSRPDSSTHKMSTTKWTFSLKRILLERLFEGATCYDGLCRASCINSVYLYRSL